MPFPKNRRCLSFIKLSVDFFIPCKNIQECQLLRLVPGNANLTGGRCQYSYIHMNCLDIQIRVFQNDPLNFSHRGPNQQLCNYRASFNHNKLGNVPYIGNFKDRKNEKVLKFSIFPENQTFCSPKLLAAFRPLGYQLTLFKS